MKVNIKQAHQLVRDQQRLGNDVCWDNYDIVFFRPAAHAMTSVSGVWRKGQWQFANRFTLSNDGTWTIDERNLRRPRHRRV